MYKGKRIIGIIPARGGSKGIPKKNIIDVNGKYLIEYTIDAAKNSKYMDEIIISTDSSEIAKVCEKLGVKVPFLRPDEMAGDDSRIIDSVIYTINKLEKKFDYLVLLQPTQPLRQNFHIDGGIEKIVDIDGDSLISISKVSEHPSLMKVLNNEKLENIYGKSSGLQRQEFNEIYKVNGSLYINKIDTIDLGTVFNDNEIPYIMDNKYDLDIDEFKDLDYFKYILKKGMIR